MKKNSKKTIEKFLPREQINIIRKLNTPSKVQDFLDSVPFNFENSGETYMSPSRALKANKMHCFEGALFGLLCLEYHGYPNFLMDLKVKDLKKDDDHTLCAFKIGKHWGAISKTNHAVLRYRDPIYKSARELAISYYHEYFIDSGEKTLKSFSKPYNVWKNFGYSWIAQEEDLDDIALALDKYEHTEIVPKETSRYLRKAGKMERNAAILAEYQNR